MRLAILLELFCKFPFWVGVGVKGSPLGRVEIHSWSHPNGEGLSLGESGNSLVVAPRGGEGLSLGESGMLFFWDEVKSLWVSPVGGV
jgi:hypothetical protein